MNGVARELTNVRRKIKHRKRKESRKSLDTNRYNFSYNSPEIFHKTWLIEWLLVLSLFSPGTIQNVI